MRSGYRKVAALAAQQASPAHAEATAAGQKQHAEPAATGQEQHAEATTAEEQATAEMPARVSLTKSVFHEAMRSIAAKEVKHAEEIEVCHH